MVIGVSAEGVGLMVVMIVITGRNDSLNPNHVNDESTLESVYDMT